MNVQSRRLLGAVVLFILTAFLLWISYDVNEVSHPIFNGKSDEWTFALELKDIRVQPDGKRIVWKVGHSYVHENGLWFNDRYNIFDHFRVDHLIVKNLDGSILVQWFKFRNSENEPWRIVKLNKYDWKVNADDEDNVVSATLRIFGSDFPAVHLVKTFLRDSG